MVPEEPPEPEPPVADGNAFVLALDMTPPAAPLPLQSTASFSWSADNEDWSKAMVALSADKVAWSVASCALASLTLLFALSLVAAS